MNHLNPAQALGHDTNVPSASGATIAARSGMASSGMTPPSSPPIYLTTAFDFEDLSLLANVASGSERGYIYTRDGNPNHDALSTAVAQLEGAEAGVVTGSGMGALAAVLLALLKTGDHVIAGHVLYGRTGQQLNALSRSFGIQVSYVDMADPAAVAAARTPTTRLCIAESLTNPLVAVTDIPAIAAALGDVPLLVDNTFATPVLLRPLSYGATYVWHSASKYLNGHGDVMQGVLVGSTTTIRPIRGAVSLFGLNSNPLESWLAGRGLKTLWLRMSHVSASAQRIAEALCQHPAIHQVFYPGLPQHPSYEIATRLMPAGCGGMLAFDLRGGRGAVDALFRRLAGTIPFSPTLADTRTTFSYPAGTSHKFMTQAERDVAGIGPGLVRLSVGLENPTDLIQELTTALEVCAVIE